MEYRPGKVWHLPKVKMLHQLQKQCVRVIYKKSKRFNVNELIKQGGILSVYNLSHLELCKLWYKVTHKLLPEPLCDIFNKHGGKKTHKYHTRGKNTRNIQKHHSVQFNKSFLCKSVALYTKLLQIVKAKSSFKSFTISAKKYILS